MRLDDEHNRNIRSRDLSIDLNVLQSFVEVAALANFTKAAEKLGRAQSTLSAHIAKMEAIYGGPLFTRTPQGATLTQRGEHVRAAAERMLDVQVQTLASLRRTSLTGALRVGVMDDYALDHFPRVLKRFAVRNPDLSLKVEVALSARLHERVETGALDIAVARRQRGSRAGTLLIREELDWVAAAGSGLPDEDPVPLVLFDDACLYREAVIEALVAHGTQFYVAATGSSFHGVVASTVAGLGVTVLSKSTVPASLVALNTPRLPDLGHTEIAVIMGGDVPETALELERELFREHPGLAIGRYP